MRTTVMARIIAAIAGLACIIPGVMAPAAAVPTPLEAPSVSRPTGPITVSAAASLTDVLPVIARAFEKRYPGTSVTFNFGGSSGLVSQVLAGAPVDVLATASEPTMRKAVDAGAVNRPLLFAKNTMAIAMPSDNPARITSLADLARPGLLIGMCDTSVPCGAAARDLLARNRISITPVTRELDVRALLAKVISGDLDAGIVYATDVRGVGNKVASVSIPVDVNVTTAYPIATVGRAANPQAAVAFVNFVRYSLSAQGILRAYGFAKPW